MGLVARERLVYLIDPVENTARQIRGPGEPLFAKERHGAGAPAARFAVNDDVGGSIELAKPSFELAQRNEQRAGDAADCGFRRLADVEDDRRNAPGVEPCLQLADRAFGEEDRPRAA